MRDKVRNIGAVSEINISSNKESMLKSLFNLYDKDRKIIKCK